VAIVSLLWASERYLNLALSSHPSVPPDTVKAVRTALLEMADEPEGAKVLAAAAEAVKAPPLVFLPAKDSDFDNMQRFYRTSPVKIELQ
jgi:phosphonate transport system substrate-binding protein